MSECGRCPERRADPTVLCALMLTDRHCAASLDPDGSKRQPLAPGYYRYDEHDQLVPFEPKHNEWPPRTLVRIMDHKDIIDRNKP